MSSVVPEAEDRPQREVAQRVFAAEFNDAKHSYKESGDRSPRYAVSPQGTKMNRIFAVGVLTRVESAGNQPGSYKATLVDPTGTFSLWAGQFEPEAAAQLGNIQPPAIAAVVGKASTREFEGTTFVNVRPETIRVVEKGDRDAWIIETAKLSMLRLDAMREAQKLEGPTTQKLQELGYPKDVAEGVVRAIEHYGKADLAKFAQTIRDALETLTPGGAERMAATPEFTAASTALSDKSRPGGATASAAYTPPAPAAKGAPATKAAAPAGAAAKENPNKELILGFVTKLDDGKGAPWEDIVAEASRKSVKETEVEECLNALMDDGLIYEPVLGRLKKT